MNGVVKVKKDQQGFGFITPSDGGKDIFFHFAGCAGKVEAFNDLQEGMEVSFELKDGQKGPMAVNINSGHSPPDNTGQTLGENISETEVPPGFISINGSEFGEVKANAELANEEERKRKRKSFLQGGVHLNACDWLESDTHVAAFFDKEINMFVLSIDIRRSTELMLKAKTGHLFGVFLTTVCNTLREIIKNNYGVFEKFTGDGILAFFPEIFSGQDAGYFVAKAAAECHTAFFAEYRKSYDKFSLLLNDVGLGIGIDFGAARLVEIASGFAIIGTPVVYACRFSAAPAGQTYTNISAYAELTNKFDGSISLAETDVLIKHEGSAMAYATTFNSTDFMPTPPKWNRPTQTYASSSKGPIAINVQAI